MRPATPDEIDLHRHAGRAAEQAYVPYSNFPVGAAIRVRGSDTPVLGANVENASYGLTSCAERNAVFAAVGSGHRDLEAIAVHGRGRTVTPCGACRQVLAEFAPPADGGSSPARGELVAATLDELLPERSTL